MSLDKSIEHGKEKRKPYRKAKSVDKLCRNHGACYYCSNGRQYKNKKRLEGKNQELKEMEAKNE